MGCGKGCQIKAVRVRGIFAWMRVGLSSKVSKKEVACLYNIFLWKYAATSPLSIVHISMEKHQKGQKVRDERDRWRHEIYPILKGSAGLDILLDTFADTFLKSIF